MTTPDFEISARLEADTLTAQVPPDVHTLIEGDGVVLERAHSRRGVPAQLEPGARYSDISIEQRLRGQNEGHFGVEKPRPATAATAAFPEGASSGSGISPLITRPAGEGAVENQDMSTDLSSAAKRRAAREKRRKTLSLERQPLNETVEPTENGSPPLHDDAVSDSAPGATRSMSVRVAFGLGALVGAAAGATAGKHDNEEGMSTGKKALAGAAVGLAVPAAVTVAKKLRSGDDGGSDEQQGRKQSGRQQSQRRSSARRSSSGGGSSRSRRSSASGSKSRSGSSSSRSSAGKSRSGASSRSRSSSGSSSASGGVNRGNRTKEQLYNQAKRLGIEGRSSMTKQQLERAIARASS